MIWDCLLLMALLVNAILIPLKIFFSNDEFDDYDMLENIAVYILIIDMLINFNTAFYSRGILISDKL
jgi:hypothetical protein